MYTQKWKGLLLVLLCMNGQLRASEIVQNFTSTSFNSQQLATLKLEFGKHKIIPVEYETQILIALSYFPELKNISIEFKIKKTNTPLSSRPTLTGLLQSAKSRKYIITISESSQSKLESILLKNLSFNAQVGVLGHELSHVSDYITKGFGKMVNLLAIEIFSKNQVDHFESRTDLICIHHGLGYQLLEWSTAVRQNLKIEYWRGADNLKSMTNKERYLNPEKILKTMNSLSIYCPSQDNSLTITN